MSTKRRTKASPRFELRYVLLCEEVRPELGGKMTLIGFYGSDTILVGSDPAVLRGLAFIFGFDVLRGALPTSATFRLEQIDGDLLGPELTIPLMSGSQDRRNVIVQTSGLEVRPAEYKVSLSLDGERLASAFTIRSDPEFINKINAAQHLAPS